MPRISAKNQITLPVDVLKRAGLAGGDEVLIEADEPDRIIVRRARRDWRRGIGVFHGLYPPGYLDDLRRDWR
ncbi:MAG: AbrB/MazE/SpoVT family DNA-binding domain-containing protein [Candidatus Dormibacteria bacterium]